MKTILSSLVNVLPYSWLWHSAALEFSVTVFCWFIAQPLLKATKKAFLLFTPLEKRRKTAICICSSPFYTFSCLCKCKAEIHYGIASKHFFVCEQNTVKPIKHFFHAYVNVWTYIIHSFFIHSSFIFQLFFRSVQPNDAGKYECQISTLPKMSHFLHLSVIGECICQTSDELIS